MTGFFIGVSGLGVSLDARRLAQAYRRAVIGAAMAAGLTCITALSGCAWLDAKQRLIIYRPTPGVPADFAGFRPQDQHYFVPVPDALPVADDVQAVDGANAAQRLELWWLPHARAGAPTLLYLHGTFRNLYENLEKINALREAGFAVLAVDYRGWGQSSGIVPSEQSIMQDAATAWRELKRLEPRPGMRVIYGHSMGSGAAVGLASGLVPGADYGALILESAFTSFPDIAWQAGVIAGTLSNFNGERFDSLARIGLVKAPLLMIHGSADTTVPPVLGESLFSAANEPKQWVLIPGGTHSGLQADAPLIYQATLRRFIRTYLGSEPVKSR
jgi:pimeloyl-ACP methyl ester carboxylesterase